MKQGALHCCDILAVSVSAWLTDAAFNLLMLVVILAELLIAYALASGVALVVIKFVKHISNGNR